MSNMNNNLNFKYHTEYANKLVKEKIDLNSTISIVEEVHVDGYDNDGPKAYIYYLFVITDKKVINSDEDDEYYTYSMYTADKYYRPNEIVEYYLEYSMKSKILYNFGSFNDYLDIYHMIS